MRRIAVLASGGGTNLQSLIDHFNGAAGTTANVALVISDRSSAGALERAARAAIQSHVIAPKGRTADDVSAETLGTLEDQEIDIVALAGYLRLVPASVVKRYRGRILNIHPALLPAFGGAGMYGINVHRAVLEAGCRVSGATVHHVDERYDEGKPIVQWPVPVLSGDSPDSLAARVLRVEHIIYPLAVESVVRHVDAESPDKGSTAPATRENTAVGSPAGAEAAFEWTGIEGIEAAVRRLLEIGGDPT